MLVPQRDLAAVQRTLTSWLRARLPGGGPVDVGALKKPGAGMSNETLLFDAITADGAVVPLVARLKPTGEGVFPEYDLSRQYRVMAALATAGIPVPSLLGYEPDDSVLGSPFYVMRRIDGWVPSDVPPYHAFGPTLALSPADRARLWWAGVDVLARVHRVDWRAAGLAFLGEPGAGTAAIDRELDAYARYLEWARGDEPQPVLDAALAWLREHRYAPAHVGLCWGDARLGNVLFQGTGVGAVLDWEMAFLGDQEADLAWWLFLDWTFCDGYGVPRLEGFPAREETIARWETLTGRTARHLDYQEVLAAFRYGVILLRVSMLLQSAGVAVGADDMATNNVCTQRLAALLDLPPPGAPPRAVANLAERTARVQFHLTGPGGGDWYVVAERGTGSRHEGVVADPDATLTVAKADWDAIQRGELNRTEAFFGGKMQLDGDITLFLQLEDLISRLSA
jgi:aminoglycoside phosphotransferase (APT) family kinase protein/putative sterol carrier protein